jgi:subtilase family serine protease
VTWALLGAGTRLGNAWQLAGVTLGASGSVRARGRVHGGYDSASSWLVETVASVEDLWVEGPDLQIATLNSPLEAPAGSTQPVAWTLANRGVLPATENWIDRVFLSTDAAFGNDRLLGEFAVTGPLAVDETRPRQQAVPLPLDLAPDRDYWWIVVTDAADAVREQNEGNNVRISESPMRLLRPPAPNLVVAGVEPSANPRSGQPMTVTWSVRNAGTWSTGAGLWKDAVYLSADATLDDADRLLGRETRLRALGLDESYTNTLTTVLPPGTQGTWHLLVATDVENRVNEDDRENDNLSAPVPVAITLTPPPDLQVLALQIPAFASSGESIPVAWTGTNAGPGGTIQETWIDDVYLSPTPTLGAQSIRVASVPRTGALAAQASYAVSVPVTIPTGLTGTFHVLVFADAGQQVFEHESEGNNVAVAPTTIQITLTPPPDLAVAEVSAPASALASHALTLSYGVTNRAAVATPGASWEDRLYLVTDPANANLSPEGGSGVLYLGSLWRTGVLPAGQSYGNSFTVTLPDGLSGDWYAVVQTDAADAVFEVEHANNRRASAAPIRIESRPADLIVTAFGAPASAQSGAGLTASWTVRNQGTGDSAVTRWTDRVMLSLDGTPGNEDDVVLLTLEHEGLLAAGATYSIVNQLVSLPLSVPPGDRRLFVVTDAGGGVYEAAREDNNLSATRALTVTRSTADLRVAAVSVAPSPGDGDGPVTLEVRSEDVVTVRWTVENSGVVAPNAGAWADAVYLSASGALDDQAILLGTVGVGTPPAPGAAYSRAEEFVLPAELAGEFRVLVVTDATGEVIEENRANNLLAGLDTVRVTLRPVPDLEVVAISGPAEAYSGQPAEFTWTVRNNGPAAAPGEWFDRVYLSADATFDPDEDMFVGYAARPAGLAAGESYTQTVDLTLPREVSGLLQLVVVCDGSDRVNERGAEANNVARAANTVAVWLRPPTDLEVGTITIPADGVAGYELALTYTLHNRGANGAYGPWVDSLYFSTDDRWDVDDVLFAHVGQTGVLAAGESRTRTATAPAPGVLPGQYHVIVRSDVLVQVPDTDRSNNVRASLDRVASGVEELVLGQAAHRGLSTGQALYYRIGVPAGQWLVIEVDAAQAGAATELYVRGAAIPTRSEFDWTDAKPLQADHRLVIPETQAGEYYVLVYGNQVPAPGGHGPDGPGLSLAVPGHRHRLRPGRERGRTDDPGERGRLRPDLHGGRAGCGGHRAARGGALLREQHAVLPDAGSARPGAGDVQRGGSQRRWVDINCPRLATHCPRRRGELGHPAHSTPSR